MHAARPLSFIVLLGIVSLFADMTYEGARSATGPFLAMLGASAFAVALVSGGGELIGYALRLWSGRLVDRTQRYWTITGLGYAVNLLAVPLLALAGNWPVAATLILVERAGKRIQRTAENVVAATEFAGALDRLDVLGILDDAHQRRVATRIRADPTALVVGDVAAHRAEPHAVADLGQHGG